MAVRDSGAAPKIYIATSAEPSKVTPSTFLRVNKSKRMMSISKCAACHLIPYCIALNPNESDIGRLARDQSKMSTMAMTTLPALVNPIWQAATTRQRHLTYGEGPARRFYNDVLPLAALENHSVEAVAALTDLVTPGEQVMIFEEPPSRLDARQWRKVRRIPGYQMVCERLLPQKARSDEPVSVMLDPVGDAEEMVALKAIAFPGLFGIRTPQLGGYRGIRVNGALVAMAGERLALYGYREVSAVCTHPAHLGHGYAQQLTREVTAAILADGDIPFLHVAGANGAAVHIYEQLGFVRCADALFVQLERRG
jgi:predicted GNAT family acetyltransferase